MSLDARARHELVLCADCIGFHYDSCLILAKFQQLGKVYVRFTSSWLEEQRRLRYVSNNRFDAKHRMLSADRKS